MKNIVQDYQWPSSFTFTENIENTISNIKKN